jgi:hypothetical protein
VGRFVCAVTVIASLHAGAQAVQAAPILIEGFDNVAALAGWVQTNNSTPPTSTAWFQGNPGVFPAQAGAADSYIAANFLNAADGGTISNWLILPEMTLTNGDTLSFFARSDGLFADRLEVRFSASGASTDVGATEASVGDFTSLLLAINGPLLPGGFPEQWAQFAATLSGLGGPTSGRFAFRYNVPDSSVNANYIGLDSVVVDSSVNTAPVPEPGTLTLLGAALAGLATRGRRRRL